ncbi:hypothetical protein SAMN05421644_13113 [Allochromatium warmingii]|uniref:Uncharacterized protein n=1 Tax=Allochromatium warmingii TaxID=61595 RepID=A0A1H3H964_ALLWA|nr:hypothetical protein SAMN05421644_13113 [Allochromatium warmingii]
MGCQPIKLGDRNEKYDVVTQYQRDVGLPKAETLRCLTN